MILLEQYDERTIALAKLLNLTKEEIDEISEGNTYNNDLSYGGIDYFVGTDGEAEDRAREYLIISKNFLDFRISSFSPFSKTGIKGASSA